MSNNSTQRQAGSIDNNQRAIKKPRQTGSHYVKHHGYAHEDFAEQGDLTEFNGIRVVDESASGESEAFEDFTEMRDSDWTVNASSGARLSDGTILYEGRQ